MLEWSSDLHICVHQLSSYEVSCDLRAIRRVLPCLRLPCFVLALLASDRDRRASRRRPPA